MSRANTILRNRIAIIFDFDETLKAQGYENVLAKAWALIQFSNREQAITKDLFKKTGSDYPLYSGVNNLFPRLRQIAEELV